MTTIEDDALDLPELVELYLGQNRIKSLTDIVFDGVPKIAKLRLHRNQLERIGRSLYGLYEATSIELALNDIQDIDLAAFAKMPRLDNSGFTFETTPIEDGQQWNSTLETLFINRNRLTDPTDLNKIRIF